MKTKMIFTVAAAMIAAAAHGQTLPAGSQTKNDSVVELDRSQKALTEIVVKTKARRVSETAVITQQKESAVAQTSTSAEQIARTQDKDAGEVIRRVPGISIIEEKFVMVRGLSQRYNNVWLNYQAVPSSEADARAFSFDLIPSSQLDNLTIVKAPSAEYPSDFSGGFILINTKDVPSSNTFNISLGGGINSRTHWQGATFGHGSSTDFLGFDSSRGLPDGIHTALTPEAGGYSLSGGGLNNDWTTRRRSPLADLSLAGSGARRWDMSSGAVLSLLAAANYSNSYRSLHDMANNLFGAYDHANDQSVYLRQSTDQQYNHTVRLGAMLNLAWLSPERRTRLEWKNIFNQIGRDRYTTREGLDAQSDRERSAEYFYQSRTTIGTQLAATCQLTPRDRLTAGAGYSFANRDMPDRRRYNTVLDEETGQYLTENLNEINREFSYLKEHILSANADLRHSFSHLTAQAGGYTEYRTRRYDTRQFIYCRDGGLTARMQALDPVGELLREENYGPDGLYLLEQTDWRNNYKGNSLLGAGYVVADLPLGRWNIHAGVRFEHYKMELISNTRKSQESPTSVFYTYDDFFPSVNLKYTINDRHQLRASYGRTTNRAEFREVSSSVYYDYDLASNVQGNYALRPAYIDNVDVEWEWYPRRGEMITLSLFYKHFKDPIEWTYTVAGGTDLIYSYVNAQGADNYGVELDIRKELDFIGLPKFSVNLNGSWIHSRVNFPDGAREKDRPMQGQSPYLINGGLFYTDKARGWNIALLYNRIGKRIIGVGRSLGGTANEVRVPDSYEMPRSALDLTASKRLGHWQIKAAIRDILAEKVQFKQFEGDIEQIVRSYRPGRNFNLSVTYTL